MSETRDEPSTAPRLVPGQRIDDTHVAFLRAGLGAGMVVDGIEGDVETPTVRVVAL